ncbi:extracellular catalytic domain type 1 short-chain-length polyhydroxyalkanoate depolymerase [Roseicyclus mahoneyensis]|uniref:Poly(Hydroxyalkanoate) depolymerase family esterase n=1 Tax=Roseicyclus mahoneyensis TaxID=164332 RepID=A0A316GK84_9RHOB|nr:PHB depolymerase family esterase [Roseicyclus mahoneyensis]PWK61465.1 poly(hydroxyalkanoate) depolymerase family esterase [Roseicyclus mahoneyensis]
MTNPFTRGMARATDLTRSGKLTEATALIRSLLHPKSDPQKTDRAAEPDTIEGSFTRVDGMDPKKQTATGPALRKARKGLAETLRGIAAGGMPPRGAWAPVPVDLRAGAQFLSLTHSGPHGRRDYRLYVPAARPDAPMPLIVMLHGCTQTPEDFATGTGMNTLAEEFGCLVAWPAQPGGANAQKCWNWFRPEDQGRDRGEPALIAAIVQDILRDHPADPARVYAAGLSAGGAAAAILGAAYPDIFAAVGVHSGLPVGSAQDVPSAFAAMQGGAGAGDRRVRVPTIVFHGSADTTVHPANGKAVLAQAMQSGFDHTQVLVSESLAGGRSYRQTRHDDRSGRSMAEHWVINGAGHAWAGGNPSGSYTDPKGPDASREMLRFFLQHKRV